MSGPASRVALKAWLEANRPPVPPPFLSRLLAAGEADSAAVGEVARARCRPALAAALAQGGERKGAFRLLAADAWITYACESALALDDPEAELLAVLTEVLAAGKA